jgi:hypothetical protein
MKMPILKGYAKKLKKYIIQFKLTDLYICWLGRIRGEKQKQSIRKEK